MLQMKTVMMITFKKKSSSMATVLSRKPKNKNKKSRLIQSKIEYDHIITLIIFICNIISKFIEYLLCCTRVMIEQIL